MSAWAISMRFPIPINAWPSLWVHMLCHGLKCSVHLGQREFPIRSNAAFSQPQSSHSQDREPTPLSGPPSCLNCVDDDIAMLLTLVCLLNTKNAVWSESLVNLHDLRDCRVWDLRPVRMFSKIDTKSHDHHDCEFSPRKSTIKVSAKAVTSITSISMTAKNRYKNSRSWTFDLDDCEEQVQKVMIAKIANSHHESSRLRWVRR